MNGQVLRSVAAVVAAAALAACGALQEGTFFDESFWGGNFLQGESIEAELGLAEMAKGNYGLADSHFTKALKRDPRDVRALLGKGILYQNTGQATKAREMYEAIIAIRPPMSERLVVWTNFEPRPISEIASVNLSLMQSGGIPGRMGQAAAGQDSPYVQPAVQGAAPPTVSGTPSSAALLGRTAPAGTPRRQLPTAPAVPKFSDAEANLDSRFQTLMALRDQGLITQDEFNTRRQANIGALLPLTAPPPATGLDRPVPNTEQISARLRAIGRALELRAITISQHTAERSMILDALMPGAPVVVANPPPPPQGLMAAADAVRRLEQLNTQGFITTDEYSKERTAIELAMQPRPMLPSAPRKTEAPAKKEAKMTGPQPAVHLASYRSRKAADRGWAQLRRAHKNLLGNFKSEITRVNLGTGKGTFYRLKAGPVKSAAAASELCRKLKRRRQYCEATFMGSG